MRRALCVLCVVLSSVAVAQSASAQLPTVQFQGTYNGLMPYIDWAWWLTPSQMCLENQPFYGSQPATGGPYPVLIYLHGTLADWGNNVEGQRFVQAAAAHGFVAAAFNYDSWITWGSPRDIDLHANCMFNTSSPGNGISQICARPQANCSNGFVVTGFSQGAAIGGRAKNFNAGVQGLWAMGLTGPNIPEALATPTGTRALPNNKLRITLGQGDIQTSTTSQPDFSALNAMTGQSCTTFNCLRPDGSGYYVVSNSEVSSGMATHCYWYAGNACSTLSPTLDPTFVSGTTPWSLSTNLSWLAGLLSASIDQAGPAPQNVKIVRKPRVPVHPAVFNARGKLVRLRMSIKAYARAHGAHVKRLRHH
jgi:hypothetical protein